MNILGISCYYHDAAAALLCDGQLVAAAEEERFSRLKHDFRFPRNAISFCLEAAKITNSDLDYVVFYEKPSHKFDRILKTVLQTYPQSWKLFQESMTTWALDKIWIASTLKSEFKMPRNKILFCEHHLSHAASAFLCSPFEEAAILTVDGVGEWATCACGTGRGSDVYLTKQMEFPHSIGLLYTAFTVFLGFEVNEGEYKVMGMAPYGQPRYVDKVWRLVRKNCDGSFSLDMSYFSFHYSTTRTFNRRFTDLFGPPRSPDLPFFTQTSGFPAYFGDRPTNYSELCKKNEYYADVAASIQQVTEDLVVNMANALHRETGLRNLCVAGGVGLNSVANSRIRRETPFQHLYIQPAAGDGGGALGAALWVCNSLMKRPRTFVMEHAYWGRSYTSSRISSFLRANAIVHEQVECEDQLLQQVAERLARGEVVGWFDGRFEWGPRALGNRSILADPRNPMMKDTVNTKIKFREPYRPFAPSVLAEYAEQFFDLPDAVIHYPARYMLYVVPVREECRSIIPAVTHVDGTGRIQVVFPQHSPRYYKLIDCFRQITDIPVLLNTSFNLRGEPIVDTPENAFSTFLKSGIDCLVMDNFLIEKCHLSSVRIIKSHSIKQLEGVQRTAAD